MPIEFSFRATGSRFPASGRHPIRQTDLATGKVAPFAEYLESHEVLAGFDSRTTLLTGYGTVALSLIVVEEVTAAMGPMCQVSSTQSISDAMALRKADPLTVIGYPYHRA